ncbi:E3 ubiquitin-protein ligase TRIM21-like [Myripristis murdjan]|uniref:E3 ubiquitin-protein ligase TRIM21-like n=1 Tax=Myripristis murdjan TaxID=586833 RepID=UPI0011763121|nr:E3 ubiquitin-protein ligase TRIM21-like [Myripristis murdjan]
MIQELTNIDSWRYVNSNCNPADNLTRDHKSHDIVPLKEECEGKKAELGETESEIQQMIQKRRVKIQEIKRSVELSREDAEREIADSVRVFTALMQAVERGQAELIDMIEENFPSLSAPPHTKNWTEVRVHRSSYVGSVRRAVEDIFSKEIKKLCADLELKRVQQYEVDVTLDPNTAHPTLILSDDGKQVKHGDIWENLPDNPERFSVRVFVTGKQSFSSGTFYYEVQVEEKTDWDLGVARESINRKGKVTASPRNGYWTIWLRNNNGYEANASPPVRLSLKSQPQKVGVFVDYEEGLVSFYDVDAAALIYSYSGCSFTEKLYPVLCPCVNDGGKNSAPLIISPVSHAD